MEAAATRRAAFLAAAGDLERLPSAEELKKVRENIQIQNPHLSKTLDSGLLEMCNSEKAYVYGQAYLKYLIENGTLNPGSVVQAVTLCFNCKIRDRKNFDKSVAEKVLEKFGGMFRINSLLNSYLILLLCSVDRWREALDCLPESGEQAGFQRSINSIAISCFDEGEGTAGWKLLNQLGRYDTSFWEHTQLAVLRYAIREAANKGVDASLITMGRLIKFLERFHVYPTLAVVESLEDYFEKIRTLEDGVDFRVLRTNVSPKTGQCETCRERLKPVFILPEEYGTLQSGILEKIIKGDNVYRNTFPEEIQKFIKFIDDSESFDSVVDGLNVYYIGAALNRVERVHRLAETVEALKQSGTFKRILVVARHHIVRNKSPLAAEAYRRLARLATLYLVDAKTADDGFILYAAIKNGPRTWLVSNDRMGYQLTLLEKSPEIRDVLKRFLAKRQIVFEFRGGRPIFHFPFKHGVVAQAGDGARYWHVPFDDGTDRYSYQYPNDWLCVTRQNN